MRRWQSNTVVKLVQYIFVVLYTVHALGRYVNMDHHLFVSRFSTILLHGAATLCTLLQCPYFSRGSTEKKGSYESPESSPELGGPPKKAKNQFLFALINRSSCLEVQKEARVRWIKKSVFRDPKAMLSRSLRG